MIKVAIDSNIYLSAVLAGGKPEMILNLARKKQIQIFVSGHIITEIVRVLKRKFHWASQRIETTLEDIKENTALIFPEANINVIKAKPTDNYILECTLEAKADFLVSGDKKHILPLKKFKGISIVSPDEFLRLTDF